MTIGIWVLGDQLNLKQAALAGADPTTARVLLLESSSVIERRAYHAQKLVLVWSAMRHFAADLRAQGWTCLLYTSPSPRDRQKSRMPSSA